MKLSLNAMTKPISFILCAVLFLCACSETEPSVETIYPLQETTECGSLDNVFKKVEVYAMSNDVLVSNVAKAVLVGEDKLVMHDMARQLILADLKTGTLTHAARKGRATNEYTSINDIAFDGKNILVLEDSYIMSLNLSDKTATKHQIPIQLPFDAMAPVDGGAWLFTAFPLESNDYDKKKGTLLYKVNYGSTESESFIEREDCTFSLFNISQSSGNKYYLRPQDSNHIFYRLDEDIPVPEIRVDFGDKNIPARYYFNNADEDIAKYMRAEYYKLPMHFMKTDDAMYFRAGGPGADEYDFLYTKPHKGVRWENKYMDSSARIVAASADCYYAVFSKCAVEDAEHGALYNLLDASVGEKQSDFYIVKLYI
ncbi:MAG: 6-bladed beta-propeller [Bacteroidales bacterium]|nr:6-bladed beta-propeller [Bacteroidales bacterium]